MAACAFATVRVGQFGAAGPGFVEPPFPALFTSRGPPACLRGVKIALVTETFPPEINGVAMTFGVLARELAALGHHVTVYRPRRPEESAGAGSNPFLQQPMPGMPLPGYPGLRMGLPAGGRLRRLWQSERPDLVHVVTEGPLGASAVGAALALSIPVTSSFHTNFHTYAGHYGWKAMQGLVLAWLRRLHNRTARTFVPTLELCGQLERVGFRNLGLLSRGVDTEKFNPSHRCTDLRRSWGAGPQTCVVLHVGRLAPEKNYPLLWEAYRRMHAANANCRFVLVGEGPLRSAVSETQPHCVFLGAVPHGDIGRYYASADVYIHASQTETFGNVVLEGLSSGLAFAGFDYAAALQFVTDGKNGLLVPRDQPERLLEAAVRLVREHRLRDQLRESARSAVLAHSWGAVARSFARQLEAVIDAAR
jgi:glycosyltransferase involved in cell wall biosynthesis